jgi:hypothetical protein
VTVRVPGPHWSDLIYEIAAWFASGQVSGEIAEPTCQRGRASPVTPLPCHQRAELTGGEVEKDEDQVRIPRQERDVDWRKLERAVLGEGIEGLDGDSDCSVFGNHGGGIEGDSGGGNGAGGIVMRINRGKSRAGGSCHGWFSLGRSWERISPIGRGERGADATGRAWVAPGQLQVTVMGSHWLVPWMQAPRCILSELFFWHIIIPSERYRRVLSNAIVTEQKKEERKSRAEHQRIQVTKNQT